ncbi:MAG: response regulator [Aureispira sp.]|nr:response regulator [Aureispira sp.]
MSKLDANTLQLQKQAVRLFPVIDRIQTSFAIEAELREIQFEFAHNLSAELVIELDTSKFEKILNNLLSNALKFSSKLGVINLTVEQLTNTQQLSIKVKDTGIGIHPDDLPYIFDRFYQSKQQKENLHGGAGIGLALANRFAELFEGQLTVASQLEKGSEFTFVFPYQKAFLQTATEVEEEMQVDIDFPLETTNTARDYTILIAEDNADMRAFVESLLKPNYQVLTVDNGAKAWELLSSQKQDVDLLLSDVMMPEMNGFELLQRIKDKKMQLPVVLLTALSSSKRKLEGLTIGADDYLTKPFSKNELLARIKNLLINYEGRRTWAQSEITDTSKKIQKIENVAVDQVWMKKVEETLKKEVGNTQFGILELASELNISERQLRRRIKKFVGLTPNQYFRIIRLQVARQLLETKQYETVAEISHHIGFSNPQYFSKLYEEEFGKKPSEILSKGNTL